MAVLLGNAQPTQISQQIPDAARGAVAAEGASGAERKPAEGANNFQSLMKSFQKKQPDNTADERAAAAEKGASDESSSETFGSLVNPLVQGMEQFRQLIDSVREELKNSALSGGAAVLVDPSAGMSRFDPDLILEGDFTGALLSKKAANGFVKERPAASVLSAELELSAEELAEGESQVELTAWEEFLTALISPETETPQASAEGESPDAEAGPSAGRKALEKLAGLAEEFIRIAGRRSPALAEQLQNLFQSAREEISPDELDQVVSAIDRIIAALARKPETVSDSGGVSEGSSLDEEDATSEKAALPSSSAKAGERASDVRQQGGTRVSNARAIEPDKPDKNSANTEFSRELASQSSSAPSEAAEDAAGIRARTPQSLAEPGTSYALDPSDAFGDGITRVLQFLKNEGVAEARIVVEPPALGRVDVSLQATASGVEAIFKVDNEHLKQVLQQQLDLLKNSLEAQGIHVLGLTVDIKNRDDGRRQDTREAGGKVRRSGIIGEDGDEGEEGMRLVRIDLEKGLLHWLA